MLSFSKTKSIGRPNKYHPSDVHYVVHYHFQRISTYIESNVLALDIESRYKIYQKEDKSRIIYFETVQDVTTDYQMYPLFSEWLKKLVSEIKGDTFSKKDLFIAPLVYVKNSRNHFTTFVLAFNEEGKAFAYIIEPKESNSVNLLFTYPVTELLSQCKSILATLVENTKDMVACHNIFVGIQNLLDDVNCGPFHINFAEVLADTPKVSLFNVDQVKRLLEKTNLARRNNDSVLIRNMATKDHKEKMRSYEYEDIDIITGETTESMKLGRVTSAPEMSDAKKRTAHCCITRCVARLRDEVKSEIFGLDNFNQLENVMASKANLNHDKLPKLLAITDIILKQEATSERKRLRLAAVLFHLYKHSDDQMNHHIEGALVSLLDIKTEFKNLAFVHGKAHGLGELFSDRIKFLNLLCRLPEDHYQDAYDVLFEIDDINVMRTSIELLDQFIGEPNNGFETRLLNAIASLKRESSDNSLLLSFSTFSNNTKVAIKSFIIEILELLSLNPKHANYRCACFLFNSYLAIPSKDKTLKQSIANVLATILNDKVEFELYQSVNKNDEFINNFFKKRLGILSLHECGKLNNINNVELLANFYKSLDGYGILSSLRSSQEPVIDQSTVTDAIVDSFKVLFLESPSYSY